MKRRKCSLTSDASPYQTESQTRQAFVNSGRTKHATPRLEDDTRVQSLSAKSARWVSCFRGGLLDRRRADISFALEQFCSVMLCRSCDLVDVSLATACAIKILHLSGQPADAGRFSSAGRDGIVR